MRPPEPTEAPRLLQRPGLGAASRIRQRQPLLFRRLFIQQPVLTLVGHGEKAVRWAGGEGVVGGGEIVAIAGGQPIDLENRPRDGIYRAAWLVWDDALLTRHEAAAPRPALRSGAAVRSLPAGFRAAFEAALAALEDATLPAAIAAHRLAEVLIWLDALGIRFAPTVAATAALKVRRLIGGQPAHPWSAGEVAARLAMSEATLRRKLADEGAGFSEILADARLSLALSLLQSTAWPVTRIALTTGYASPSHFALRFRQRFGFAPSAIRRRGAASGQ